MLPEFQMPKRIEVDRATRTNSYGRFTAEPFERGFGTTVGNALRRVLLSSLEGAAVTAVQIDGVYHEFSAIPGVREDVTDIILNLKELLLEMHGYGPKVNFTVENARVGRRTDYDKLVLEVTTYDSLTPEEAVSHAAEILRDHLEIFVNFKEETRPEMPAVDIDRVRL